MVFWNRSNSAYPEIPDFPYIPFNPPLLFRDPPTPFLIKGVGVFCSGMALIQLYRNLLFYPPPPIPLPPGEGRYWGIQNSLPLDGGGLGWGC